MFKHFNDLCDVVSLLVYCPSERAYLLAKEPSGEYWLPSTYSEKKCWKLTASKINFDLFGADAVSQCVPLRISKIWLPNHSQSNVYHVVYKCAVKSEVKKKTKLKSNLRNRVQWFNTAELERQRAHSSLRTPELAVYAQMAIGEQIREESTDLDTSMLIEICEENVIVTADAVVMSSPNYQLLQAAGYNREDQLRLYREFLVMVFPALYMSPNIFSVFMLDLGWQRSQCSGLFRAADVNSRGGLSFLELMLWTAALEPSTQHSGIPAEIRCKYIFRYFDNNRDLKLEYVEFKELVAAARASRQLPVDALSVARDADVCLRQLGLQPNSQLPLADFLRGVGELRLRGTSSLLRSPTSIVAYLIDLQKERDHEVSASSGSVKSIVPCAAQPHVGDARDADGPVTLPGARRFTAHQDYNLAQFTVRLRKINAQNEMFELNTFGDDAVSASTTRLLENLTTSVDMLGPVCNPMEALCAVHYFATTIDKPVTAKCTSSSRSASASSKPAWSWAAPNEEAALGALLLQLADAARTIVASEPRLLRVASPVYAVGDLHGNLNALLAMEAALWPSGAALAPVRLLFLGDYVDRGPHGSELMAYLLAAKIQRPRGVLLVRGNHETRDIQRMFTFHTECVNKYGEEEGVKIWNAINQVFDVLPLAAVVDDKVFCCHGGIPPPWVCPLMTAIDKVPLPLARPAEQSTIAWELLWNDPVKANKMTSSLAMELLANEGFAANAKRGTGHVFNQTALDRFLLANQLSHVVRAHELHANGFKCQLRGRLISVFSSSHYCGGNNDAGVALLEDGKVRLIRVNSDYNG